MIGRLGLLFAIANLGSACVSGARPILQLNQAEKQLSRAQAVNAEDSPQAALHLKLARDLVWQAKGLMRDDENDSARHRLRRAEADAELAEMLARQAQAETDAADANRRLQRLREDGTVE